MHGLTHRQQHVCGPTTGRVVGAFLGGFCCVDVHARMRARASVCVQFCGTHWLKVIMTVMPVCVGSGGGAVCVSEIVSVCVYVLWPRLVVIVEGG